MKWGDSMQTNRLTVLSRGIALVALPIVSRVLERQRVHVVVTIGLGQNAGGGNRLILGVAFHDAGIRQSLSFVGQSLAHAVGIETIAVDDERLGTELQLVDCTVHGQETGVKDVYLIDFIGRDKADGPCQSVAFNLLPKCVATTVGELLAVVECRIIIAGRQNDSRGIHASGETTTPRLVATGLHHLFIIM